MYVYGFMEGIAVAIAMLGLGEAVAFRGLSCGDGDGDGLFLLCGVTPGGGHFTR